MTDTDRQFLSAAINRAKESVGRGGFPAGSVVVKDGTIVGEGVSIGALVNDPTSHSDIAAIRAACTKENSADLSGAVLYSSVQPCLMCLGASAWGGIAKIFYACAQEKLDAAYYNGHYLGHEINQLLSKPIEMVHLAELEEESLRVVKDWECSLTQS